MNADALLPAEAVEAGDREHDGVAFATHCFVDARVEVAAYIDQVEVGTQCAQLGLTAGAARIRVTFAVDADGLLTVTAGEETTGIEAEVAVKPSYGLSEEEMADMLYDSMKNAKDDMEARLLAETKVEAGRNLNAVSAALSNDGHLLSDDEFNAIKAVVQSLEEASKGDQRDTITAAAEQLEEATKAFAEKRMDRGIRSALRGVEIDEQASKG